MPVRIAIRERLDAGRHRLWLDAGGERADASSCRRRDGVRSRPGGRGGACSRRSTRSADDDDWGVGSFSELDRARGWIEERGGRLDRDAPAVRAVPGGADARAEPVLPRQPAVLERDLPRRGASARPGAEPRGQRRPRGPGVPRAGGAAAQGGPDGSSAVAAAKRRVLDPLAQASFRESPPEGLRGLRGRPRAPRTTRGSARRWSAAGPGGACVARGRARRLPPGSALDDERARYHLYVQWLASAAARRGRRRARARRRRPDARPPDRRERRRLRRLARTDLVRAGRRGRRPARRVLVPGPGLGRTPAASDGCPRGRVPVPRRDAPDALPVRRRRADRPRDRAAPPLLGPARRVGQGRRLRPVPRRRVVRAAVARRERDRRGRRRGGPRDGPRLRAARDAAARAPADVRRPARGERHGRTPGAARRVGRHAQHARHADLGGVLARGRRAPPARSRTDRRRTGRKILEGRRGMREALPASLPDSGLEADLDGEDPRASLEAALERLAAGPPRS